MIIIDSPFHITFSSSCKKPTYACVSMCKKCWWESDLENKKVCPQCGGQLTKGSEGVHFKILKTKSRDLDMSDLKEFGNLMTHQEKETMQKFTDKKGKIMHLSMVKEKFVERAKKEWC